MCRLIRCITLLTYTRGYYSSVFSNSLASVNPLVPDVQAAVNTGRYAALSWVVVAAKNHHTYYCPPTTFETRDANRLILTARGVMVSARLSDYTARIRGRQLRRNLMNYRTNCATNLLMTPPRYRSV